MRPPNDSIRIEDLELQVRLGVPDAERAQPQRVLLCIEFSADLSAAALSDNLADTIDYGAVAQRLPGWASTRSWRLIEALATDVANLLLTEFPANAVRIEVKKFILPQTRCVSVAIARTKSADPRA
jgi:dihydroneopterin aldolase